MTSSLGAAESPPLVFVGVRAGLAAGVVVGAVVPALGPGAQAASSNTASAKIRVRKWGIRAGL